MLGKEEVSNCGLFWAKYHIGNDLIGEQSLDVCLTVDVSKRGIAGIGHVFQPTASPNHIVSGLVGYYSYESVVNTSNILLVLEGYNPMPVVKAGSVQVDENLRLRISLDASWKFGVANLELLREGEWIESEELKVQLVNSNESNIEELANVVHSIREEVLI